MGLSSEARTLLARVLESQRKAPREFFVIARPNAPEILLHHGRLMHEFANPAALLELEEARVFIQDSRDENGRLKTFFVIGDRAEAALEQAEREAGKPSPLDEARMEIARLESEISALAEHTARRQSRRHEAAARFGRVVRWIVLPVVLLAIAGVAWIIAGFAGAAAVVVLAVVWEVATSGFGISGASIAAAAERRAAAWAERSLARWNGEEAG